MTRFGMASQHRFGCACAECCNRGRASLEEAQRVREWNARAFGRVRERARPAPSVGLPGPAGDRHHAFDWQTQPPYGSEEYLAITLPPPWNPAPIFGECTMCDLVTLDWSVKSAILARL